jgi:hypothetical protein
MAENKKSYLENEVIKKFMEAYKACHTDKEVEKLESRNVGNNGYYIGQTFTLTGEVEWKENKINDETQVYWYLTTQEGAELSLQSLMGISSLKGYLLEGSTEVEFVDGNDKKSRTVTAEVKAGTNEKSLWTPKSRHFLTEVQNILEGRESLEGKTVTFLGTAVKPIEAKKSGKQNGETYEKGYKRAIETKLWSVE